MTDATNLNANKNHYQQLYKYMKYIVFIFLKLGRLDGFGRFHPEL